MFKFIKHSLEGINGIELYPIVSLLIFFIFLVVVFGYVFFIMPRKHVDYMKSVPLSMEGDDTEPSKA